MKTLTVKQPWASLIVSGVKDVENRTWPTSYRGPLLIHSSQKMDARHREMSLLFTPSQWKALGSPEDYMQALFGQYEFSTILGQVEIVDCVQNSKSIWAEPEGWHWVLKNPVKFENPIPNVRGKLSLWQYEF